MHIIWYMNTNGDSESLTFANLVDAQVVWAALYANGYPMISAKP